MKRIVLLVLLQTACCLTPLYAQAGEGKDSLCNAKSSSLRDKAVVLVLTANLVIARPHGTVLSDERCPNMFIRLDFNSKRKQPSVVRLQAAIDNGSLQSPATGTFIGLLHRTRGTRKTSFVLEDVLHIQCGFNGQLASTTEQEGLPCTK